MGKILGDYTEARTLFAFMFYGTFCWCVLKHYDVPPELNTIVSTICGYWFGSKNKPQADIDLDTPKQTATITLPKKDPNRPAAGEAT